MEYDIVRFLIVLLAIGGLGSINAYVLARGLPQVGLAYVSFWGLVRDVFPVLRRLFDPGTPLARALKAHGLPVELADQIAELGADALEAYLKPHLSEKTDDPAAYSRGLPGWMDRPEA